MRQVKDNVGLVFNENDFVVVKKAGKAGDLIEKHNHPEANVLFTVVKGEIDVTVTDETFNLLPGKILHFDGNNFISAKLVKDSEAFVTLVTKKS